MKKTKKRKSAVALLTKRKKFGGIFFRRWIIVLSISVIICFLLGERIVKESFVYEKDDYEYSEGAIINAINKGPQYGESNEFFYNRLKFVMTQHESRGTTSLLYNAKTGEIILGCEEQIIFTEITDDEECFRYACPTKDIEGWDEYRKELLEAKKWNDGLSESIDMKYIYIDGASFLPGKFTVTGKVEDSYTYETKVEITKTFNEPENLPSNYVKTEISDDWKFYCVWGYSENNLSRSWTKKSYEEMQNFYKMSIEEGEPVVHGEIYYETFEVSFSGAETVVLPTGEEAVLLTVRYYDAWIQYGQMFITVGVIVLVLGILISLVWAKVSYTILKSQYDMEDYRKTLMNTMAHDLKSPLMSISGYAENLKNNINTDKKDHYAESILGNVNYMNGIIESVLTLGKTENEKLVLKKEKKNVAVLFEECLKKYELQMNFKNLKLNIEGDGVFNIDVSLFTQAIDNLVGNAVKYASEKSEVNVQISNSVISISNKCDNMPEISANELCEAFVVGNENRSNKTGSGLGLAIVKNICELHKFNLEIKCENNEFIANISNKKWRK